MNKEHTLIRLVDDDESLLFSTKILLEALGWKVAAYNSPTEVLVRQPQYSRLRRIRCAHAADDRA